MQFCPATFYSYSVGMWSEKYENSLTLQCQLKGEGQTYITMWKEKNNRLVTGWINNSVCSISKADFFIKPQKTRSHLRGKTALIPSSVELDQVAEYFIFTLYFSVKNKKSYRKKRHINTQSQNEVTECKEVAKRLQTSFQNIFITELKRNNVT